MRLRFKSYAGPELDAWYNCERNENTWKGKWKEHFVNQQNPIHLELGCGKGGFISQLALKNPHRNYIGIDMTDKVLILAKRNIEKVLGENNRTPDNVCITAHDIERIRNMLGDGDVIQRIYINFCNPWSKKSGQTKHRLTHPRQLLQYRDFLAQDGEIWFKCDHDELYEATLEYLPKAGFEVVWQTWDLHKDEGALPEENIRTEHEEMFTQMNLPTHALIAKMVNLPEDFNYKKATETEKPVMKKAIATQSAPSAIGPYSQAIAIGDFLFCSGQIPLNPETGLMVEGGIEEQTQRCFDNIKAVLAAENLTLENVVKTTVFLQSMGDFAQMNAVYEKNFEGTIFPARSAIEVAKLPKDALVEIEIIASK